ncbi:MAG TPA: FliH/SctL family protein [Tepidisphaeraceae bacterium]|jgi:flagellar assembly protein FliH|nr:FliH/SctL family protein [Tepidisphaeraceae bacterium]
MPLIKSTNAPSSLTPFSMTDIEDAARKMLLRARRQANSMLAAAQAEAEQLKAAAKTEGLTEGKSEGLKAGHAAGLEAAKKQALVERQQEITNAINACTAAANQFNASRIELAAAGLNELVKLALAVARRVTKRQSEIDPQVLAANLAEAMQLVLHAADVRIVINPAQRATLERILPELRLTWPTLKHVDLIEDAAIAPGGCRLHTATGQIDADLDAQFDRLAAELLPGQSPAADLPAPALSQ